MKLDEELRRAKLRADKAPVEIAEILLSLRTFEDRKRALKTVRYIVDADDLTSGTLERYARGGEQQP